MEHQIAEEIKTRLRYVRSKRGSVKINVTKDLEPHTAASRCRRSKRMATSLQRASGCWERRSDGCRSVRPEG